MGAVAEFRFSLSAYLVDLVLGAFIIKCYCRFGIKFSSRFGI